MALKAFAFEKFQLDIVHQLVFFRRQGVGVHGIDSGKVFRFQLIGLAVQIDGAFFPIEFMEQQSVVHIIVGMAINRLSFQFSHDDVDGLYHRFDAIIFLICLHGKEGKGPQADAITTF